MKSRREAPRRWPLVAAAAAITTLYIGCPAREEGDGAAASTGSFGKVSVAASAGSVASTASGGGAEASAASGAGGCASAPLYLGPAGWLDYTDWQCNGCRIYVPESAASLPLPLAWEACPAAPAGISCQTIAADWQLDNAKEVVGDAHFSIASGTQIGRAHV